MKNAIIILNYNDYKTTEKLVDKVKTYKDIDYIVIVDNCSTDQSFNILKDKYSNIDKIDIIKNDKNNGYASGNNFGIKYAINKYSIEYFFVANPDIMFEEKIIEKIERKLIEDPNVGIVAPKVSKGYNSWKLPTYIKTITSMFLWLNKKRGNEVYKNQSEEINYADVIAGSFFAMTVKTYEQIKGLDEDTFLYYEENILGYKIKNIEKKNVILGNITYDHNHATSIKKTYKSKIVPFLIMVKSVRIYNKKYLKIGVIKQSIFNIFFIFALIERYIYDFYLKIKLKDDNNDNLRL